MSDKSKVSDKSKTSDKLDKFLKGEVITLNCLIPGEGDIFEIPISNANNNRVSSLAEAIRNRRQDLFKDIDSSRLKLYKNKENAGSVVIINLKNNNEAILDGTELMNPENTIRSYFNAQPTSLNQGEKGVNVIVYSPVVLEENPPVTGL
jgi:hypothetical protein